MSEEMQGQELGTVIHDEAPKSVTSVEEVAKYVESAMVPVFTGVDVAAEPPTSPETPLFTPPAGDVVSGDGPDEVNLPFLSIKFQSGSEAAGINGVQVEDVIDVAIARLVFLDGRLSCQENKDAINFLMDAKARLNDRTAKRVAQGVEGTDAPHT